jgi:tricarballylate dehydrogenase
MADLTRSYDVLVAGGGNAAICAAIEARAAGASVLVLEHAPPHFRGGNTRHTRNFRAMHSGPVSVLTGAYEEEEYWQDLLKVTGGHTDEHLARVTIRGAEPMLPWMERNGVRFQPSLTGTLSLSRTNAFFLGGGKALLNALYATAERMGVEVLYDAEVLSLDVEEGRFRGADITYRGYPHQVRAKAVVAASGGFQANIPWLSQYWGEAAENFLIRGTPYNRGRLLRNLLDQDAVSAGDPTQFHAVAIDARAPQFDGGIVTRTDCIPFGVMLNREGRRFYDEGEDLWPKRYAIWGRLIAQQPGQIGYCFFDAKTAERFMPSAFPPVQAGSIAELAGKLGLDAATVEATIAQFNDAVRPGLADDQILDECRTEGLDPPKSHWAHRVDTAPFYAYPLRPGITFTFLGVKVTDQAQVLFGGDRPSTNIFAAGEIMAGNILGRGYLAGFGMSIGGVFGRIAGREAARHALA